MKKLDTVSWIIVIFMLSVAAISVCFLPSELAVQWNSSGVSNTAAKWIVFLFPAIAAFCMWLKKLRVPQRSNISVEECVYYIALLLVFAAEIIIICNGLNIFNITRI